MTPERTVIPPLPSPETSTAEGALPTFIVIGGMKCGTTSLHRYLDLHPEIGMSGQKELAYFVTEWNWGQGEAWYRTQFDPRQRVRGESSPQYTSFPKYTHVPERMHTLVPEAKLIYVVRDPIERLVSHYRHNVASGRDDRELAEALAEPDSDYLARSQYFRQLERYLAVYSADRILIVDQHDLRHRRPETLREVFSFLEVDPDVWDVRFHRELHRTQRKRVKTPLGERLSKTWPMRRVAQLPEGIRWMVEDAVYWPLSHPVVEPEISPALRAEIADRLAEDLTEWRAFTGRAFAHWSL